MRVINGKLKWPNYIHSVWLQYVKTPIIIRYLLYTIYYLYVAILIMYLYTNRLALDSIIKEIHLTTGCRLITMESRHVLRARVESVVWFILSLGLAIFIPDILKVMGPLGGLASLYMMTFPGT